MKKKNRDNGLKIGGAVIALVLIIHWGNVFFKAKDTFTSQPKQQSQSTPKQQPKSVRPNSNIVTFDRCYNTDDYNSYNEQINDYENVIGQTTYEINLSEEKVTSTTIMTDKELKWWKEKNVVAPKIKMETYPIAGSNSQYISTGFDPEGFYKMVFSLKTGQINGITHDKKTKKISYQSNGKCEIYR